MKTNRRVKPSSELTERELEAMSREFDKEFIADAFQPLTPAARRLWEQAKRKRGRPQVGAGSQPITVTVEKGLLREVDRLARQRKVTRAQLIAQGLRAVLLHAKTRAG